MSQADIPQADGPGKLKPVGADKKLPDLIRITSSPQYHAPVSTSKIMWTVVLCLVPASIWGIVVFGPPASLTLGASILASVLTEFLIAKFFGKFTLFDGSAFLTGLLVGMNMPPSIPLYIPVVASVFAIAVVKWTFGGLGGNWMNPALAGRVFVFFSWTGQMTNWTVPATNPGLNALSGATPLGFLKTGLLSMKGHIEGPVQFLGDNGYSWSTADHGITSWLNEYVFGFLGIHLPNGYIDLFLGNIPGSLGEVSALLLLAGAVYLFVKKIITWQIPSFYIGTFALLVWIFGGTRYGNPLFSGDILFNLFTGGLILGVFYMATDMVTSPMTGKGMIIYAVGAGFLTFLIRLYGSFPEGVSLAIILMNIFVPLINRYTGPRRFGVQAGRMTA